MKMKTKALTLAVAAALGAGALPTYAQVTGVPGEALLVPLMMNDPANQGTGQQNTYVQIRIPTALGQDFVYNNYTTPNVAPPLSGTVVQDSDNWRIHWTAYDYWSGNPYNGTCYGSSGDSILWTTDSTLLADQRTIHDTLNAVNPSIPQVVCGSASLPHRIGYVLFQTENGTKGYAADFAMEGNAWITDFHIAAGNGNTPAVLSVPVMAMADGDDVTYPAPISVGANEVIQNTPYGNQTDPLEYAPLATGVRMNNGLGGTTIVKVAGGVQGPYPGNGHTQGFSLHAFWFDKNDPGRPGRSAWLWDEHEEHCSFTPPLPWEVNLWVYNMSVSVAPETSFTSWTNVDGASVVDGALTNLVEAVHVGTDSNGYNSRVSCYPIYWPQTIRGYVEYTIPEELLNASTVQTAAVMFEAQEDNHNGDAWARHMMTGHGFQ